MECISWEKCLLGKKRGGRRITGRGTEIRKMKNEIKYCKDFERQIFEAVEKSMLRAVEQI